MTERRCRACGRSFRYAPSADLRRSNRQYCSRDCASRRTPAMIAAEEAYGRPLGDVILDMLNGGASITATADRLGVHRQALYGWMRRFGIRRIARWEMRGGAS